MVSAQIKPQPASTDTYPAPLVLRLPGGWALTDDCIIQLGALNNALWFERTAEGALLISPPPGWDSSEREGIIFAQISDWRFAHDGDGARPLPAATGCPTLRCSCPTQPGSPTSASRRLNCSPASRCQRRPTSCLKCVRIPTASAASRKRWSAGWPTACGSAGCLTLKTTASGSIARAGPTPSSWSTPRRCQGNQCSMA